jgi:hypothetical protein
MFRTLGSLIKFKYMYAFNLIVHRKNNTGCVSLVNTIMCLNLIEEVKVQHWFCPLGS